VGTSEPSQTPASPTAPAPLLAHPLPTAVVAVALAAVAFACYPIGPRAALAAFFAAVLVVLAATDLERRIIPNRIVLPATAIVLIAHIAITPSRTIELILAPLAAALFLLLPNLLNSSAMGMGDVKLALLLGAGLGWGVIGALLVGFLSTLPIAIAMIVRGGAAARKQTIPLGPFLAFGGLVVLIVPRLV
jgi:leader peptidase (prepilin peptidase) / N-methyltransferase